MYGACSNAVAQEYGFRGDSEYNIVRETDEAVARQSTGQRPIQLANGPGRLKPERAATNATRRRTQSRTPTHLQSRPRQRVTRVNKSKLRRFGGPRSWSERIRPTPAFLLPGKVAYQNSTLPR